MDVLKQLKEASAKRCVIFGHALNDWSLPQWGNAVAGETGELCNVIKKIDRGDKIDKRDGKPLGAHSIGDEAADIVIYLDLLCQRAGVDLASAIVKKFNEASEERNSDIKIG